MELIFLLRRAAYEYGVHPPRDARPSRKRRPNNAHAHELGYHEEILGFRGGWMHWGERLCKGDHHAGRVFAIVHLQPGVDRVARSSQVNPHLRARA